MPAPQRFPFAFAPTYRLPALAVGVTPWTAFVEVSPSELHVRFGPWSLRSALTNIEAATVTGPYGYLKTFGPAHLSFEDRGVTFATNGDQGLCLTFRQPVKGIDPTGRIVHPGATVTVADVEGLRAALSA